MKARRMRLAGHVARMGQKWNEYRLLAGKPNDDLFTSGKENTV
jgi:hypothetical protein